jgi:hypothetical protein
MDAQSVRDATRAQALIEIEIEPVRGIFHAVATYAVQSKTRTRRLTGNTRIVALRRIVRTMRKNGHGGKPYVANIDGTIMRGTIPKRWND